LRVLIQKRARTPLGAKSKTELVARDDAESLISVMKILKRFQSLFVHGGDTRVDGINLPPLERGPEGVFLNDDLLHPKNGDNWLKFCRLVVGEGGTLSSWLRGVAKFPANCSPVEFRGAIGGERVAVLATLRPSGEVVGWDNHSATEIYADELIRYVCVRFREREINFTL